MFGAGKIDINKPRWDQSTYQGRAKHFFLVANPLNVLVSGKQLETAREIVTKYRAGASLSDLKIDEDTLWRNKYLYDSAFHPDTGEKMILIGRMSAQVPMNMLISGCMMTFYKTTKAVVFWQWFNQSFNAVVNYTNRSGSNPIPVSTLVISYCGATFGAVGTALSLNKLVTKAPPLIGRLVPFTAVAAANCVNIPLMRFTELQNGIELQNDKGDIVGQSQKCAIAAISLVAVSRILMAAPGMVFSPVVMNMLEKRKVLARAKWASAPIQVIICGLCLTFATPLCCALFPQKVTVAVDSLEEEAKKKILAKDSSLKTVYYNKGL